MAFRPSNDERDSPRCADLVPRNKFGQFLARTLLAPFIQYHAKTLFALFQDTSYQLFRPRRTEKQSLAGSETSNAYEIFLNPFCGEPELWFANRYDSPSHHFRLRLK
jgi:hypothetical protein